MSTEKSQSDSHKVAPQESAEPTTSALHNLARDITMQIFPEGNFEKDSVGTERLLQSRSEFSVGEQLGAGGMGRIYRAHQRDLQRDVAIKQLHPHLCEVDRIREGFFNEAIVTGKLAHPNVVPVYGLSQSQQSLSMSMKLISGCTLENIICPETPQHERMAAKFDVDDCIEIVIAICNPVAFAHSKQIIHRDIKPGNVMVGEFGEILLLDWGLACSVSDHPEADKANGIPHVSTIPGPEGTLSYMAPEMMDGVGNALGIHSDIYLLGACLYFVLSGKAPHRHRLQNGDIPEERDAFQPLPQHIDSELRRICARAMAHSPRDRYPSVKAFQAELKDYLKHQESRQVAERANSLFSAARRAYSTHLDADERIALFHQLAECLSSYRQSLALWEHNDEAREAYHRASLAASRMMFDVREYKAAMVYLKDMTGAEANELRMKVRWALDDAEKAHRARFHLRIAAMAIAGLLLATVISAWLVYQFMENTAAEVGNKARKSLVEDGKRNLGLVVRSTAETIGFEKQTIATALNQFAVSFTEAYKATDINESSLRSPAHAQKFVHSPRHKSLPGSDISDPLVTFDGFVFHTPGNTPAIPQTREQIALNKIVPQIKRLYQDNKNIIIRYFMGFKNSKILAEYPGSSDSLDTTDITESGWFNRGANTTTAYFTPPYPDRNTNRLILSAVMPIRKETGELLGVAGAQIYMSEMLQTLNVAPSWAGSSKMEIARILGKDVDVIFSPDYEKHATNTDSKSWVPRETISDIPAHTLKTLKQNLAAGREGVIDIPSRDRPVLWGYAPLGIQKTFVLISVDHATLTREADEIKETIISSNTRALIRLGRLVALIFSGLSLLSIILAMPLVKRHFF